METKKLNIHSVSVDGSGRVILSDETLRQIEESFIPTAAGVDNTATCDGDNYGCTNTGNCVGATNHNSCTNGGTACRAATDPN